MKIITIAIITLALAGCQTPDEDIRADIASKAQQDLNFSGLTYTVKAGIVDFNGTCPSEKAFAKIKEKIENIHVIKAVHYNITIAPVTLDALTPVKLQADSILAKYPQVIAKVDPTWVTLTGEITAAKRLEMVKAFNATHINNVKDGSMVR